MWPRRILLTEAFVTNQESRDFPELEYQERHKEPREKSQEAIDRCMGLMVESRDLIKKSEALLKESQQLSETPRFTYLRLHLQRAWWKSSPRSGCSC